MTARVHYESPPTRCPVCGYSLVGLPSSHKCPECGEAYDKQTHVWRLNRISPQLLGIMVVPLVIMFITLQQVIFSRGQNLTSGLIFIASLAFVCWYAWRNLRKGWLVAVLPRGVYAREGAQDIFIQWSTVERLSIDLSSKGGLNVDCGIMLSYTVGCGFGKQAINEIHKAARKRLIVSRTRA